jgi:hypothetical protein
MDTPDENMTDILDPATLDGAVRTVEFAACEAVTGVLENYQKYVDGTSERPIFSAHFALDDECNRLQNWLLNAALSLQPTDDDNGMAKVITRDGTELFVVVNYHDNPPEDQVAVP